MRIGVMYSGIRGRNGADYVAEFLASAGRMEGHDVVVFGEHGGAQVVHVEERVDFVLHSSGFGLTPSLVKKFRRRCPVVLWTHNDEMPRWQRIVSPISREVDLHYSYTRAHPYGVHVRYLPLACDHHLYYPLPGHRKRFDVALVGSKRNWRAAFLQKMAALFPRSYFNLDMKMPTKEVNRLYNETRVVLAPVQDCDQDEPGRAWGCPCRTFEVPGAGAFQIQVDRGGLRDVYDTAVALPAQLDLDRAVEGWKEEISRWLENEQAREERQDLLHQETVERNLYIHRLRVVVEDMAKTLGMPTRRS